MSRTPNRTSSGLPPIRSRRRPRLRVVGSDAPQADQRVALYYFRNPATGKPEDFIALQFWTTDEFEALPPDLRPPDATWLGCGWLHYKFVTKDEYEDLVDIMQQTAARWRMMQVEKGPKAKRERERLRH
jgi:hypothetical protein